MALLKKIFVVLAALVMLLLGLTIGMENNTPASFMLLGMQFGPFSMGIWTLMVFGVGLVLGVLLTLPPWLKSQRVIKRYRNRLLAMEKTSADEESRKIGTDENLPAAKAST